MLRELSSRLLETGEKKKLKYKLEHDLSAIRKEVRESTAQLDLLGLRLKKEQVDVEKLEQISLTALFYSVLGSREQQLEKERQELLSAELAYQKTKHYLESLKEDLHAILAQLDKLSGVDGEYEKLLTEKEVLLRQTAHPIAAELIQLSEELISLNTEQKEISEAISAGTEVVSTLDDVSKSLESAENWGTWDMLGGGLISTAIKHSHIDDARKGINDVQVKMGRFKRELADVRESTQLQINIGDFESVADYIFDGLIVDWIVQSKIVESLDQATKAKNEINLVIKQLENQSDTTQQRIGKLHERRAQLLERA